MITRSDAEKILGKEILVEAGKSAKGKSVEESSPEESAPDEMTTDAYQKDIYPKSIAPSKEYGKRYNLWMIDAQGDLYKGQYNNQTRKFFYRKDGNTFEVDAVWWGYVIS